MVKLLRYVVATFVLAHRLHAAELPAESPDRHLGVTACNSVLCHNAVAPWRQGRVRLDEYRIWRRDDAHARAYDALLSTDGQRIGQRVGVVAEKAPLCLDCHTDRAVATGAQHTLREGVTCEACHGGAERWLESHARGASPEDNLARGMYPARDPVQRAELCVSCHVGTAQKQVTHRLLAAGHPRLVFELDTFTAREPPHAVPKASPTSAELWATGQGVVARARAALLASPTAWRGPWPELSGFDCATCHRDARDEAAPARPISTNGRMGVPRLDRAAIAPWLDALATRDAATAAALARAFDDFDAAVTRGAPDRVARAAAWSAQVNASVARTLPIRFTAADVEAVLRRVADCDQRRPAPTYLEAEQLTMAAQALLATRESVASLSADARLAPLFAGTRRFWDFAPTGFTTGLRTLCPHD